jgi:hypothetical protein
MKRHMTPVFGMRGHRRAIGAWIAIWPILIGPDFSSFSTASLISAHVA